MDQISRAKPYDVEPLQILPSIVVHEDDAGLTLAGNGLPLDVALPRSVGVRRVDERVVRRRWDAQR